MTTPDAFLTNCRLADRRLVDIGIADGKIAIVGEGAAPALSNSAPALDIGGDLVLPGLVDGHMHLDKTLTGLPWMGHAAGPTRMSRIETDKTILPHLPLSTEERAGNLIRECVARGTSHLRTHVDIDLESGLAKLDGVLAAREHYRDRVTVQSYRCGGSSNDDGRRIPDQLPPRRWSSCRYRHCRRKDRDRR